MRSVVAAVDRRINGPLGGSGSRKARVRELPDRRIEIVVLDGAAENVKRIERLVESPGTLEFRILANTRDHQKIIDRAAKSDGPTEKLISPAVSGSSSMAAS